jgi:hypothetical protein
MLTPGRLDSAFRIYWDAMDRCRRGAAYWSLLHVTMCLPDICAALQSDDGETTPALYKAWCDQHLSDPALSSAERYRMRCRVLHQGRASIGHPGRYTGFSFAQPTPNGQTVHMRLDDSTLILDVGRLSDEVKAGVERWIRHVEASPTLPEALNTERNLPSLVQVRQFTMAALPVSVSIATPIVVTRSS